MAETKKFKVLLVDDDQFLLKMYTIKFQKSGFDVEAAAGGLDALSKIRNGFAADILLLDLVMPGMDGLELLERIKKENLMPKALFVILTNQGQSTDIEKAKKMGIDGYIVKALSIPSEVVEEVKDIIKKKGK